MLFAEETDFRLDIVQAVSSLDEYDRVSGESKPALGWPLGIAWGRLNLGGGSVSFLELI
jgi:hypothetical protein